LRFHPPTTSGGIRMRLIDSMYRNVPERQALRLLMYSIRSGDIARTRWSDVSDTDGGRYQDVAIQYAR